MLVTLTGGAGAGMTTLATAPAATTPQGPAQVLYGDDYYFRTPEQGVWASDESGVSRLDVGVTKGAGSRAAALAMVFSSSSPPRPAGAR